MAKYWTCKYGANHDIGEACDCEEMEMREKELRVQRLDGMIVQEGSGQLVLALSKEATA